jgi:phage/plasmid-associated DNA primase
MKQLSGCILDCLIPKPWIVAAENALVDLRTGKMRRYSREDFVMRSLGCDIDPKATCPRWQRFMRQILPKGNLRRFRPESCRIFAHRNGGIGEVFFCFCMGMGIMAKQHLSKPCLLCLAVMQ